MDEDRKVDESECQGFCLFIGHWFFIQYFYFHVVIKFRNCVSDNKDPVWWRNKSVMDLNITDFPEDVYPETSPTNTNSFT